VSLLNNAAKLLKWPCLGDLGGDVVDFGNKIIPNLSSMTRKIRVQEYYLPTRVALIFLIRLSFCFQHSLQSEN